MRRAVLWDLDGTLADTAEYHWIAWRDTMARANVTITYEQFLDCFGQRNDRILGAWLPPHIDAATVRRIGEEKEAEFRRLAQERGLTPLQGAAEWVIRLYDTGWLQAIASSAPRLNVEVMLEALSLSGYFAAITSAEDVSAGKPDPQVFLVTASRLGVAPSRSVVVEDAPAGIEAARRAGMHHIGVNRTTVLDADIYVPSLADLGPDTFDRLVPSNQQ